MKQQIGTPNWPVHCTALAACLGTLGVELDPAQPFSRVIEEANGRETLYFIFRDRSTTDATRITEHIIGWWQNRERFEAEHPEHPLVWMRAAIDKRDWLVKVIKGAIIPQVPKLPNGTLHFQTDSILDAAVLLAHRFPLAIFTGRAFAFPSMWTAGKNEAPRYAQEVIDQSRKLHGQSPAQWMRGALASYNRCLSTAKNAVPRVITVDGDRTLNLSADAPKKVRDQFFAQL